MRAAYSYAVAGLVFAFSVPVGLVACASDNGVSSGSDGGEDSGPSTGGKHTGTGGRTSTGGSTGSAAGGNSSGGTTGTGMCAAAVPTECDGPEDCPSGQLCCGEYNMSGYDKFSCMSSCGAGGAGGAGGGLGMGMGPILFEMCHAGQTCADSTAMCLTSPYLPSSLSRCLPMMLMGQTSGNPPDTSLGKGAHELNCGSAVCGSEEQCCIRQPLEPYCAPKGATCACDYKPSTSTDGGTKDGGGSLKDGGSGKDGGVPEDARAPSDASSKHD